MTDTATAPTLEDANAALRTAVEDRLAGRSPMAASLEGCKPALEAATQMLSDAAELGVAAGCCEGVRRPDAAAAFKQVIEAARPARLARETHPSSQAFYDLCDVLKEIHAKKSYDYGSADDPLANIRNGADFVGIEHWRGAMVRLSDKVTRLATYCRTGRLEHEGVEDTLLDLASYSLLALLLHREQHDA